MYKIVYLPCVEDVVSYTCDGNSWIVKHYYSKEEAVRELETGIFLININKVSGNDIIPPFQENPTNKHSKNHIKVIPKYKLEVIEV